MKSGLDSMPLFLLDDLLINYYLKQNTQDVPNVINVVIECESRRIPQVHKYVTTAG